jgi:small redox-active disulfide protein 2
MMGIQVLGTGCKNCKLLFTRTEEVLKELGKEAGVEKIEDMARIMSFGVMATPALVVDGKLAFSGFVPSKEQIKKYLLQMES